MLATEKWSALAEMWSVEDRDEITMIWHQLEGEESYLLSAADMHHLYLLYRLAG